MRAAVRYFRDPAASPIGKLFVLATVAYVIMPIDLIPDVPLVGWLDDLGFASLAVAWLGRVTNRYRDPVALAEGERLGEEARAAAAS
jgi:uncharacterized membrane protein YkvA (DUF1232 family)